LLSCMPGMAAISFHLLKHLRPDQKADHGDIIATTTCPEARCHTIGYLGKSHLFTRLNMLSRYEENFLCEKEIRRPCHQPHHQFHPSKDPSSLPCPPSTPSPPTPSLRYSHPRTEAQTPPTIETAARR